MLIGNILHDIEFTLKSTDSVLVKTKISLFLHKGLIKLIFIELMKSITLLQKYVFAIILLYATLASSQVGIGTTTPSGGALLDLTSADKGFLVPRVNITNLSTIAPVTGGSTVGLLVWNTNTGTGVGYHYWSGSAWTPLTGSSSGNHWDLAGNAITSSDFLGTTNGFDLQIRTNNLERMRILSDGNVGIGTASPSNKLDVEVNAAADGISINNVAANGDPILRYQVNGNNIITMGVDDNDSDKFKIGTTAITTNTRLTIQTNGNIGIGTTAPGYDLEMTTNVANDYIAAFENTNNTGSSLLAYKDSGNYNALGGVTNANTGIGAYGVSLPDNGSSIGVWGTSNSSNAYGVYGTIPTSGSWLGYGGIFTGGLGYVNGLYNLSDERVKSNIETIKNPIEQVMKIKGVSYNYNLDQYNYLVSGDTKRYLGFLAQNIKEVFPEAVAEKEMVVEGPKKRGSHEDRSKYRKEIFNVVDYTAIVPVLVEAVKEQQKLIEEQNTKISEQEERLNRLEELISNLSSQKN